MILQKRLEKQSKKETPLELLRKQRLMRQDRKTAKPLAKLRRSEYSSQSESEAELDDSPPVTCEDAIRAQVLRNELEEWCHRDSFRKSMVGAFARLSVGYDPQQKKSVYRVVQIVDVVEYHRVYKFRNTMTKSAIHVSHGKAKKTFLMDITSNAPITPVSGFNKG
jgi:hypothetical protein